MHHLLLSKGLALGASFITDTSYYFQPDSIVKPSFPLVAKIQLSVLKTHLFHNYQYD